MVQLCGGDLVLDAPLFNAHTSAVDALWLGLPLISLPLERMASRVSVTPSPLTPHPSPLTPLPHPHPSPLTPHPSTPLYLKPKLGSRYCEWPRACRFANLTPRTPIPETPSPQQLAFGLYSVSVSASDLTGLSPTFRCPVLYPKPHTPNPKPQTP
jgi:hypothetical protein